MARSVQRTLLRSALLKGFFGGWGSSGVVRFPSTRAGWGLAPRYGPAAGWEWSGRRRAAIPPQAVGGPGAGGLAQRPQRVSLRARSPRRPRRVQARANAPVRSRPVGPRSGLRANVRMGHAIALGLPKQDRAGRSSSRLAASERGVADLVVARTKQAQRRGARGRFCAIPLLSIARGFAHLPS